MILSHARPAPAAQPLVSVVMPVRDAAPHLNAAIRSIQAQTVSDWELIIVDNHSRDESPEIALRFAAADARIQMIECSGGDRAAAKNAGIRAASGRFIARMDADDVSVPERFAVQLDWLRRSGAAVCGGWARRIGAGTGLMWFPFQPESIRRELLFRAPLLGPTVMAEAHVLRAEGYSEQAGFKDYEQCMRLVRHHAVTNVPAVLLGYRCHPRQSHVLEADAVAADIFRLGGALFREMYPEASDRDAGAVRRVAARAPFTEAAELERAGSWLARLAQGDDLLLRERMRLRWRDACRRSVGIGPEAHRTYVRGLPEFGGATPRADSRLAAAARLRARRDGPLDRLVSGVASVWRRWPRAAA